MFPFPPNPPHPYLPNFMFSPAPSPLFPKIKQNKNKNQIKQNQQDKTRQDKTKNTPKWNKKHPLNKSQTPRSLFYVDLSWSVVIYPKNTHWRKLTFPLLQELSANGFLVRVGLVSTSPSHYRYDSKETVSIHNRTDTHLNLQRLWLHLRPAQAHTKHNSL